MIYSSVTHILVAEDHDKTKLIGEHVLVAHAGYVRCAEESIQKVIGWLDTKFHNELEKAYLPGTTIALRVAKEFSLHNHTANCGQGANKNALQAIVISNLKGLELHRVIWKGIHGMPSLSLIRD